MSIILEGLPTGNAPSVHRPFQPQLVVPGPHPDSIRELAEQVQVLLADGEVLELTALDVSTSDFRRPHTRAGLFDRLHLETAVCEALAMSGALSSTSAGKPAKGVYMNIKSLDKDVLARRNNRIDVAENGERISDNDVVHRNWLMLDFDTKRSRNISSTDLEKEHALRKLDEAVAFLKGMGWPDPVRADSGNGYHAYYRIDLPNDKEATDLVRDSINAIADRFNNPHVEVDRKVFNASRITKFPGTYARKGDSTLERPHRQSRLLSVPKGIQIVPPEMLRDLVATLGKTTKVGGHTKVTPAVASQVLKVPARDPVPTPNGEIVAASQHLLKAIPPAVSGEGGHDRCFHAACTVVQGFNLGVEDGLAAMDAWNRTCQPPWSEPELRHKLQDASKKADEEAAQPNGRRRGWLLEPNRRTRSDSADPVLDLRLNDVGNAQRFAEQHCADVRYCWLQRTWYVFDGCRWKSDSSGEIDRRAKATAESIGEEIAAAGGDANRRLVGKWAADSHSERHIRNMISLARSERVLQVAPEQFDQDRMLFNVRNGTVDLRTGRLRPHTRTDHITKLANVDYDVAAVCPRWERFLDEIMGGNARLVSFLNRAFGYCLTGDVSEQDIFIGHGTGANGKSTFLKLLLNLMGDYGRQAAPDLLLAKRGERHPTEIADLFGSRFTAAVEAEDNRQLAEALVKQLTGGDGTHLASGGADNEIRIWSFPGLKPVKTLRGHTGTVTGLVFLAGGRKILSGSWDATVRLWDVDSAEQLSVLRGHTGNVAALSVALGEGVAASASFDTSVRLWRLDADGSKHK